VTDWQLVWLGTIAIAVAVMAAIQVAAVFVLIKAVLEAVKTVQKLQRDLTPLLEKAHRIADDAAKTSALAAAQAERIDALVTSATERVDETLQIIQEAIVNPIRQGTAFVAGLRAVIAAFKGWREKDGPVREEDDALFIG
jgi:hypothetical protein